MVVKLNPALTSGHAQKLSFGNSESNASHIRVNSTVAADAFVPTATATKRGAGAFVRKMALAFMATCTTLGIGGGASVLTSCNPDKDPINDTTSIVTDKQIDQKYKQLNIAKYGSSNLKSTGDTIAYLNPTGQINAQGSIRSAENGEIKFNAYLLSGDHIDLTFNVKAKYQPDGSFISSYYLGNNQLYEHFKEYIDPKDGKVIQENLRSGTKYKFSPLTPKIITRERFPSATYVDTLKVLFRRL